jgi:glycosyltransferase involved in cell wall biosynthesis
MKNVFIIYRSFFDKIGEKYTVGGIQTYIRKLVNLINKMGDNPIIVQFAEINFKKTYKNITVYGLNVSQKKKELEKSKAVVSFIKKMYSDSDIIIFASDDLYVPVNFTNKVIAIQHGITWDKQVKSRFKRKFILFDLLVQYLRSYQRIKQIRGIKNLVCVDYNFINWYRTQVSFINQNIYIIPNFTEIDKEIIYKEKNKIKILFARRFEPYRGTRLFAKVAKKILEKYDNVYISFAGSGSDEKFLKEEFSNFNRVNFMTYESEKSLDIHASYHIAVIPSIGSEGSSLSLLEAMASKCAIVATNVGGMTNIILDNYNGLLVNPNEKEIFLAIEKLISDDIFREKIALNAYHTVKKAFNKELWEEKWEKVFNEVSKL